MKKLLVFGLGLVIGSCYGAFNVGMTIGRECIKRNGTWTIDCEKYNTKHVKTVTFTVVEK